jgi:hypothetical protein
MGSNFEVAVLAGRWPTEAARQTTGEPAVPCLGASCRLALPRPAAVRSCGGSSEPPFTPSRSARPFDFLVNVQKHCLIKAKQEMKCPFVLTGRRPAARGVRSGRRPHPGGALKVKERNLRSAACRGRELRRELENDPSRHSDA